MKKTIITVILGLSVASMAAAATTRVDFSDSLTTTFVTDTEVISTLTASDTLSLSSANTDGKWYDSTTTFTLDMTALSSLTLQQGESHQLVTLNSSTSECAVGLAVKNIDGTNKFVLTWNGNQFPTNTSFTLEGSGTYSLITEYNSAGYGCTYFFDSGATTPAALYASGGSGTALGTKNGTNSLASVVVDSDYVTAFAVTNKTLNVNAAGIGAAATALTIKAIPEPTTATLSLLALAGLAARRRRK